MGGFFLQGITNPVLFVYLLPVFSLIFLGPVFSLVGALVILLVPMNRERRGVLGFLVFVGSLIPVLALFLILLGVVTGRPFFAS